MGIPVIAFLDILRDRFKRSAVQLSQLKKLLISALCPYFWTCDKKDLQRGIGKDDGSNITPVHDRIGRGSQLTLHFEKAGTHSPKLGNNGSGAGYSTTGYPVITISDLPKAGSGSYTVVVIVSDKDGTDIGEYSFTVKAGNYLGAAVRHTAQWDENRRQYNEKMAGKSKGAGSSEFYSFRPDELFWPGEELVLQAELGGGEQA